MKKQLQQLKLRQKPTSSKNSINQQSSGDGPGARTPKISGKSALKQQLSRITAAKQFETDLRLIFYHCDRS
jgi:hypothetical protein